MAILATSQEFKHSGAEGFGNKSVYVYIKTLICTKQIGFRNSNINTYIYIYEFIYSFYLYKMHGHQIRKFLNSGNFQVP